MSESSEIQAAPPSAGTPRSKDSDGSVLGGVVLDGVGCTNCGYNLGGLPAANMCPECGAPIERSLRGDRLINMPAGYLASLHRGAFLVLTAIFLHVLVMFLRIFSAMATAVLGSSPVQGGETVLSVAQLALSVVLVFGWWMLSAPMPLLADLSGADKRRRWVRALLVVNVVMIAAQASLYVLVSVWQASPLGLLSVAGGVTILGMLVSLAGYVVQMLYLAWLADRVPDMALFKRAKLLVWLGPVLSTLGLILLGLGPLIALIMYWNLVDRFRVAFKGIRRERAAVDVSTSNSERVHHTRLG